MAKAEDLSARFYGYVEDNQIKGINGRGEEASYVSRACLEKYWNSDRIRDVLLSCEPHLQEDAVSIQRRFPLIFSTLVYIDRPSAISYFARGNKDDHHLPLSLADLSRRPWAEDFVKNQWMFCPLEFSDYAIDRRELDADRILPLTYERIISEDGRDKDAARIWEVKIHGGCKNLIPEDGRAALKVYENDGAEGLYSAEANTYALLSNRFGNITRLYGSFSFKGTQKRMLVLEYAKGSLLDLFRDTQPPVTPDDFNLLWGRLLELTDGLHALHNMSTPERSPFGPIAGVHLDIKPSNILVFPQSDKSRFDVRFKLADFGITEMKRVSRTNPNMAIKNGGSRMYSPPECYTNSSAQAISRSPVSTSSDIWALGAVYSEVLVWSLAGEKGREDYRSERKKGISQHTNLLGCGFDACFHDGIKRLDQVEQSHQQALEHKRQTDAMSPRMSDFILDYMLLTDPDARLEAKQLQLRAPPTVTNLDEPSLARTQSLREARQRQTWSEGSRHRDVHPSPGGVLHPQPQPWPVPPQPRPPLLTELPGREFISAPQLNGHARMSSLPCLSESPTERAGSEELDLPERPPAQRDEGRASGATASSPKEDLVTVDMVYPILKDKKRLARVAKQMVQGKESSVMGLAGMENARSKIKAYGGRDQIMLIDNFSSMKPHMDKVCKAARVVSYVAKVADDNGMDLYFASDPTTPRKCTSSTAIESAIGKMKTVEGRCSMRNCLNDILKQVWGNGAGGVKSTSIYVYTDGVWEPGEHQVDHVIRHAIGQLVKAKEPSSTLMIQFIQFGRDKTGSERLRHLDDECAEVHELGEYDIVDTKHSDDHVPDIVIGSISKFIDDKNSAGSGPGSYTCP